MTKSTHRTVFEPDPLRPVGKSLKLAAQWMVKSPESFRRVAEVMAVADSAKLKEMVRRNRADVDYGPGMLKYLDVVYWVAQRTKALKYLEIERRNARTLLDLGAGGGHWVALVRTLGIRGTALDLDTPFYTELASALGVEKLVHRIEACKPLPEPKERYDIVTAFMSNFDIVGIEKSGHRQHFTHSDWAYLLNDLVERQLRFPALVHFEINPQWNQDTQSSAQNPELHQWFAENGAKSGVSGKANSVTFELAEPRRFA